MSYIESINFSNIKTDKNKWTLKQNTIIVLQKICYFNLLYTGFPVYKTDNTNFFSLSYVGGVTQAYVTYIKLPDKF